MAGGARRRGPHTHNPVVGCRCENLSVLRVRPAHHAKRSRVRAVTAAAIDGGAPGGAKAPRCAVRRGVLVLEHLSSARAEEFGGESAAVGLLDDRAQVRNSRESGRHASDVMVTNAGAVGAQQ